MSQPRKRSGTKRATSNSPSRPTCEDGTAGGGVDIEKLYRAIDFDGDGSLDVFEVSKGFEAMGACQPSLDDYFKRLAMGYHGTIPRTLQPPVSPKGR